MIETGDIFCAEVRDLTSDGKGVAAHPSGMVFFIPGVWPGEKGSFRVSGLKSRFGFGEVLELERESSERTGPLCPHHGFADGQCGGCPWQFISYKAQITVKENRVRTALSRTGIEKGLKPIRPAPETFGYRNRAGLKTDGKILGYVSPGSHVIAPVEDCPILDDRNRQTLRELIASLPRNDFIPSRDSEWCTIEIDDTVGSVEVRPDLSLPFRQSNTSQNLFMKEWLADKLSAIEPGQKVLELFAGSGNFTRIISKAGFASILAVEMDLQELTQLDELNLPGVKTMECNLYNHRAFERISRIMRAPEILILDPPREGIKNKKRLHEVIGKTRDIFYISCDLASFSRDLIYFTELGFQPVEIQPLDMFPHTPHVELLAHLNNTGGSL
jgi:23S rRNA (uracil1939-C5)-methyltransferase